MICWTVFNSLKLTGFSPAPVIAEIVRNRQSVKDILRDGVAEPQNIIADARHVKMK